MTGGGTSFAPYLITATATLAGVLITAIFAEYRERRRSREEEARERERVIEERWKWLRQERRQSYAALTHLGFQAGSTLLESATRLYDRNDPKAARELWQRLDELVDAIHAQAADVQLVGGKSVIDAAHRLRRSMRRTPSLLTSCIEAVESGCPDNADLRERMSLKVRSLYDATHDLVEAATADLRVGLNDGDEADEPA